MTTERKSLGAAIDQVIGALEPLDGPTRLTAIRAACDHLQIDLGAGVRSSPSGSPSAVPREVPVGITPATDIRSFKAQKNPDTATEMACVLAYYLQHLAPEAERKNEITAGDINKYFVQAGFPLPKRADQLLVNAKTAGYLDSASRGAYRLNPVGHNLVSHSLPRQAAGAAARVRQERPPVAKQGSNGRRSSAKKK